MQQLYRIATWLARRSAATKAARQERQRRAWARDPLSHPALSGMTPHQLADLPLERALFRHDAQDVRSAAPVIPLARERMRRGPARTAAQGC